MSFEPLTQTLPKGQIVQIRKAKLSDAPGLISCIRAYLKDHFVPITPQEFQPSIQEQEQWIQSLNEKDTSLLLVAEVGSTIVGNIDLTAPSRSMLQHTAVLGMGVHPDWQGKGIGKHLLRNALNWADRQPGLDIIWLQVFGDNHSAVSIYQHAGFLETGRQPGFFRKPDGTRVDQITMMRLSANFRDSFHS